MAVERQVFDKSVETSEHFESDPSSSSEGSPEDWGFFVDIGDQVDDRCVERTFLNSFGQSDLKKLRTITDTRV